MKPLFRWMGWKTLLLIFLWACGWSPYPGYVDRGEGIYQQIYFLGDEEKPAVPGSYVTAHVQFLSMQDSVMHQDSIIDYLIPTEEKRSSFDRTIELLVEGDSAGFILPFPKALPPSFSEWQATETSHETVKLLVKLATVKSEERFDQEQQYIVWKNDQEMNEQKDLSLYLDSLGIDRKDNLNGIYYQEIRRGRGPVAVTGNTIVLQYKGFFLDGSQFDSTYEMEDLFDFTLGDPDQVIKGFDIGVRQMRKGGRARLIIPSQLAYGEKGSTTGIVPPFTSIVYEVEILKIL